MRKAMMVFGAVLAVSSAALAQSVEHQSKDWTVFTHDGLCYIGSTPQNAAKDGKAYLLVTARGKDTDEVSAAIGTAYQPEAEVTLLTSAGSSKLFTQNDMAWAKDAATDRKIVDALKRSGSLRLKATDAEGKAVEQKYSLAGFSEAYKRMKNLCK